MSFLKSFRKEMSLKDISEEEDVEIRCNKIHWFLKRKFITGAIISIITFLLAIVVKAGAYRLLNIDMPIFQILVVVYAALSIVLLITSFIIRRIKPSKEKIFYRLAYFYDLYNFCMICICFLLLFMTYVFSFVRVEGSSMNPTYKNRDILIVRTIGYEPKRNDAIIAYMGNVINEDDLYVKRIVAVPGDTVEAIRNETYTKNDRYIYDIYVNGELIQEDTNFGYKNNSSYIEKISFVLQDDEYFIMGDNRINGGSYDSRSFGPIKGKDIVGKAVSNILFWKNKKN